MATLASQFNFTPKILDDYAQQMNMSPYVPGITSPALASPTNSQVASALRAPKPQPSVPRSVTAPAVPSAPATPTINTPKMDFSQDAMSPQANASGMTPQQMSQQAEAAALRSRAQAEDVAKMNNIGVDDAYARIARAQASQAGQMQGPEDTFYNPATGERGTNAFTIGRDPSYWGANVDKTNVRDAGVNPIPFSSGVSKPTNQQLLERFTPGFANIPGEGIAFAEAGLVAPRREDYGTTEDFNQANVEYNMMKLQEAQMIANSPQVLEGRQRQSQFEAMQEIRAREAQAGYDRAQKKAENSLARDQLLQSLALRGLTPETSESARKELLKFDALAEQAENAAAAQANVAMSVALGKASSSALDKQKAQAEAISKQIQDALAAFTTQKKTEVSVGRLELDKEKAKVDQAYKEGRISLAERDLMRKALETEATVGLKEAQTEKLDTMTPIEAEQKKAQTEKTKAETTRIQTLTPLEAQKMKTAINKSTTLKGGAGGTVGDKDIVAAVDFFYNAEGKMPTDKQIAVTVKYLRESGKLAAPVEAGKAAAKTQGERKATITPPKATTGDAALDAWLSGGK